MLRKPHASSLAIPADILRKAWTSCVSAVSTHTPTRFDDDTPCRQLFDVLDGRLIVAANQRWQITVYAVVDDGVSRWVQMTVGGKTVNAVTIRIESGAGSKPVIRALAQWLNTTQDEVHSPEIVSSAATRCA